MELLYDKLKKYSEGDSYPFHMPGHKRQEKLFDLAYSIDITEIDGFDDLHHPNGILKEKMKEMADFYGADSSYYLINGSTCGLLAAISSVTELGDEIIISRNCHKSVFHATLLRNLKTYYVYPQMLQDLWINGGITAEDVEKSMKQHPGAKAVVIVSPTYEGIVSDIKAICEAAHKRNIPVIVDEAHGAHFNYGKKAGFPVSALDSGADLVVQSLHKTLPSLTQTAVLHKKSKLVRKEKIEQYLSIYQTSSPSYILMSGIDACLNFMYRYGKEKMKNFSDNLDWLYTELRSLKKIWYLSPDIQRKNQKIMYDFDRSKIVFGTRDQEYSGLWLSKRLRESYQLEMEMSTPEYVIAMTSPADSAEGLSRLMNALKEIDSEIQKKQYNSNRGQENEVGIWKKRRKETAESEVPEMIYTPYETSLKEQQKVALCDAKNCICANMIYVYPPGIPLIVPGERITENVLYKLSYYKQNGFRLEGLQDEKINVVKEIQTSSDKPL